MPRVGIALGSNLGDRLAHLRAARDGLRRLAKPGEPLLEAPVYQTEPRFCPAGSPPFLNTVVEIAWEDDPSALLDATQALERALGRTASPERNAPRVIDIDLIYCGDTVLDTEPLVLPHPRLFERRFVLEPLAAIRPDLRLPGRSTTLAEALRDLASDEPPLVRIDG